MAPPPPEVTEAGGAAGRRGAFPVAGCTLGAGSLARQKWVLAVLSLGFLVQYSGPLAVAAVLLTCLAGFATLHTAWGRQALGATLIHCVLFAGFYLFCWRLRSTDLMRALQTHGLSFFVFLRHVSFVVEVCGGAAISLNNYLCFLVFYPGASGPLGSPEVYADFARRNLVGPRHQDYPLAARKVIVGALQVWAAHRLPISIERVLDSPTTLLLWLNSLLLFVRVAFFGMGAWSFIEATALLYGWRLQPNFRGLLTRQNPSEFWWAWRGSLTNWLVRYVYGPLGASHRHQSLNILAAFTASMIWHWLALPFWAPDFRAIMLLPITAWCVINAVAVVGHVNFRRLRLPTLTWIPLPCRRAVKIALTGCLGSFSATLPSF